MGGRDLHPVQLGTRRGDLLDAELAQLRLQLSELLDELVLALGPQGTGLNLGGRLFSDVRNGIPLPTVNATSNCPVLLFQRNVGVGRSSVFGRRRLVSSRRVVFHCIAINRLCFSMPAVSCRRLLSIAAMKPLASSFASDWRCTLQRTSKSIVQSGCVEKSPPFSKPFDTENLESTTVCVFNFRKVDSETGRQPSWARSCGVREERRGVPFRDFRPTIVVRFLPFPSQFPFPISQRLQDNKSLQRHTILLRMCRRGGFVDVCCGDVVEKESCRRAHEMSRTEKACEKN